MLVPKKKDLISLIESVINNNFNIFLCKESRRLDMVASSKPKFLVVNCFLLYHCGEGLLKLYKRYWNIKKGVGTEILWHWIWIWVYVGMWDSLTRAFSSSSTWRWWSIQANSQIKFFNYLIIKKNKRAINGGLGVFVIVIHWFLCKVKNSSNKGET